MFYHAKLININLKKSLVALTIFVLGFVGVNTLGIIKSHADNPVQTIKNEILEVKNSLHQVGEYKQILTRNGYYLVGVLTANGFKLTADKIGVPVNTNSTINNADGTCSYTVTAAIFALGAAALAAAAATGGLEIAGVVLSAEECEFLSTICSSWDTLYNWVANHLC